MGDIFDQLASSSQTQQQGQEPPQAPAPAQTQPQPTQPTQPDQAQGDVFDQLAKASPQSTQAGQPPSQPQSPNVSAQSDSHEPGFFERAWETSGAKGIGDLLSAEAMHRVNAFNKALDAVKEGDHKTAAAYALIAVTGATKDDPVAQAARQLVMMPLEEVKQARAAAQEAQFREKAGLRANDQNAAMIRHAVSAVPIVGPTASAIGEAAAHDLHIGDDEGVNWSGLAGDVFGPLATLGMGKAVGKLGKAAESTSDAMLPKTKTIAGVDVPVSAPQIAGAKGIPERLATKLATQPAAQEFLNNHVQPEAVKTTAQNLVAPALATVDDLRRLRGQPLASANPPAIQSIDGIVDTLRTEAKPTFQTLDKAVEPELTQWEADKQAWEHANPEPAVPKAPSTLSPTTAQTAAEKASGRAQWKAEKDAWQASRDEWEEDNPKPKTFTELQDQVKDAKRTIGSESSSQVDKADAKRNLPLHQQEIDDYINKYGSAVSRDELDAANKAWAQSHQYEWLADRVRTATRGTTGTASTLKQTPMRLNVGSLERMPSAFDNQYGAGAFKQLIGPQAMHNYNDVINALTNPIKGATPFDSFLTKTLRTLEAPVSYVSNRLLFDPAFGQKWLQRWRLGGSAVKTGGNAVAPTVVAGTNLSESDKKAQQRKVLGGATSLR